MQKISIIIPVYNVEQYLSGCLDSVLAQTYQNFEAVCINDGSLDNSLAILEEYAQKDERIKIISQKNKGLSGARNTGLDNASGDYIFFLDSDDYLHPQTLELLLQAIFKDNANLAVCQMKTTHQLYHHIDAKLVAKTQSFENPLKKVFKEGLKVKTSACNKLYHKELIGKTRFIEGIIWEDAPFSAVILDRAQKIVVVDEDLYFYYMSETSTSRSPMNAKKMMSYFEAIEFLYKYFKEQNDVEKFRFAQKYILAVRLKKILRKTAKLKDKALKTEIIQKIKSFKANGVITYDGLNPLLKLQLFIYLL